MTDHATRAEQFPNENQAIDLLDKLHANYGHRPKTRSEVVRDLEWFSEDVKLLAAALTRAAEEAVQDPAYQECCELRRDAEAKWKAAQPVWRDKPTVVGGYWVRHDDYEQVMNVKDIEGCGFVVGPYFKPVEECEGWEFAGPLPMPREA